MKRLMNAVETEIEAEYDRATEKFGETNNSDHESYAVLLEELQEALAEGETSQKALDAFWVWVKENCSDEGKLEHLTKLKNAAMCAACEFIQVAAMAHKAQITIKRRKEG